MLDQTVNKVTNLKVANQAEILRAHQRDEEYIREIEKKLTIILHNFKNYKLVSSIFQLNVLAQVLYFLFTTGLGNQTLGEEYTGIVQANIKIRKAPSLTARVVGLVLELFGERMLINILEVIQKHVNKPDSELRPEAVTLLNKIFNKLKVFIPISIFIHKSLFYFSGRYYSFGRRLTGIDYAKVYGKRPTNTVSWSLRFLGIITIVQCFLRIWQGETHVESEEKLIQLDNNEGIKCQLCFEIKPTTVTPCGHLFCWSCIADWVRVRSQCPLCREHVTSSRIVYLMNL
ncbi:peroxisome biogenesis factor 10 [Chelonus insularis]|uniref:peroxisome biogenesis factor 10 n=1 Tax=Chelonus insularis TaxID=460826 RepID=UPI00158908F9|nr:peroxisome biogenesis factor 10 [Chelonus insularis]